MVQVNRWAVCLGAVLVAGVLVVAATPLVAHLHKVSARAQRIEHTDAVVALGAGRWADGELTNPSFRRAVVAMELFASGYAPELVLCAGPRTKDNEVGKQTELVDAFHLPKEHVHFIEGAKTTRDEAHLVHELLGANARRILLVTSSAHQARAAALFEREGFTVFSAYGDEFDTAAEAPVDRFTLAGRTISEAAARLYYRLAGFL